MVREIAGRLREHLLRALIFFEKIDEPRYEKRIRCSIEVFLPLVNELQFFLQVVFWVLYWGLPKSWEPSG